MLTELVAEDGFVPGFLLRPGSTTSPAVWRRPRRHPWSGRRSIRDPEAATVLVHPLYEAAGGSAAADERPEALAVLLGRSRASVPALLRTPATTTALAERAPVSCVAAGHRGGSCGPRG